MSKQHIRSNTNTYLLYGTYIFKSYRATWDLLLWLNQIINISFRNFSCFRRLLLVIARRTLEVAIGYSFWLQTRWPSLKIHQTHMLRPLKKLQLFLSVQDLLIDLIHPAQFLRILLSRTQCWFCHCISKSYGLIHHHNWIYVNYYTVIDIVSDRAYLIINFLKVRFWSFCLFTLFHCILL